MATPPQTPPQSPVDLLRAVAMKIEQMKTKSRFDEDMSGKATLLVAMFHLQDFSEDAFKANIKTEVNAKVLTRLISFLP
jgi:hypothetical protein